MYGYFVAGNTDNRYTTRFRQEGRINQVRRHVLELPTLESNVGAGDQRMGFTAAECCFQSVNRGNAEAAGNTSKNLIQGRTESLRGVGSLTEKQAGISIYVV